MIPRLLAYFCGPILTFFSLADRLAAQTEEIWLLSSATGTEAASRSKAITAGISERTSLTLDWKIVHLPDAAAEPSYFENDDWAKGASLIIYDGPPHLNQSAEQLERILSPHRKGVPAILIHGALLPASSGNEKWAQVCGAKNGVKSLSAPSLLTIEAPRSISTHYLPWTVANEAIVPVENLVPRASVFAVTAETNLPVAWSHEFTEKQTRVFALSLGSNLETLNHADYLDLLTGGLTWTLHKTEAPLKLSRPLATGRNLATSAAAFASSGESGRALDLDPETAWIPQAEKNPAWWGVNLEAPGQIRALAIAWDAAQHHDYLIEGSIDNRKWFPLVESRVDTTGNHLSFHFIEARVKQLRVSNPVNLVLNPIREFAAYAEVKTIPFHILAMAGKGTAPEIIHPSPDQARQQRTPVLKPETAFALLDQSSDPAQWAEALDELSLFAEPAVVDSLIKRLQETSSGKFRHLAISALASLYTDREGKTWEKSDEIAALLEGLFANKRVNPNRLLANFCRNGIPIRDMNRVLSHDSSTELDNELVIKAMEQNQVPWKKTDWLRNLVRSASIDSELRLRAATLLAGSSDFLGMRDAFAMAVDNQIKDEAFLVALLGNPTWASQIDWLAEKSSHPFSDHRRMAWRILLLLLGNESFRTDTHSSITSLIEKAMQEADLSFQSFVETSHISRHQIISEFLEKASASGVENISKAAAQALAERARREEEKPGTIPLHSLTSEPTLVGLIPVEQRDSSLGAAIFRRDCAPCHESKAPHLTAISGKLGHDSALITAIRSPSEKVDPAFYLRHFTMKNGANHSGFKGEETDRFVEVIDQAGNALQLLKSRIASEITEPVSAMPSHAADHLTLRDFSHLIAYLKTL